MIMMMKQNTHLSSFASFDRMRKYSAIHREPSSTYWDVRKFDPYLMGNNFMLHIDHKLSSRRMKM